MKGYYSHQTQNIDPQLTFPNRVAGDVVRRLTHPALAPHWFWLLPTTSTTINPSHTLRLKLSLSLSQAQFGRQWRPPMLTTEPTSGMPLETSSRSSS